MRIRVLLTVTAVVVLLTAFLPGQVGAATAMSGSVIGLSGDTLPARLLIRSGGSTKTAVVPAGVTIYDKRGRIIPFSVVSLFDQVRVVGRSANGVVTVTRVDDQSLDRKTVLTGSIASIDCAAKKISLATSGRTRALKLAFETSYVHGDNPMTCDSLKKLQRVSVVVRSGTASTVQRVVVSADVIAGKVVSKTSSKRTAGDYTLTVDTGATSIKVKTGRTTKVMARDLRPMLANAIHPNDRVEIRGLVTGGSLTATGIRDLSRRTAPDGDVVGTTSMTKSDGVSATSVVGNVDLTGWAINTTVVGQYAYVANGLAGVDIVSLADPHSPRVLSTYQTGRYVGAVIGNDRYVYIGDGLGITVLDISTPTNPVKVGFLREHHETATQVNCKFSGSIEYGCELEWHDQPPTKLSLSGDRLFVTYYGGQSINGDGADGSWIQDAGVVFVDVSDPTNPRLAIRYPYYAQGATLVQVDGDVAFMYGTGRFDSPGSVQRQGLFRIDVTDLAAPVVLGELTKPDGSDMRDPIDAIVGSRLYTHTYDDGVTIHQIDGTVLRPVGTIRTNAYVVTASGDHVYISGGTDIDTLTPAYVLDYDVSTPSNPVLVGNIRDARFLAPYDENSEGGNTIVWLGTFGQYTLALRGPDVPPALNGAVRLPASIFVLAFDE